MTTLTLDTLRDVKRLEAAGFTRPQAEAQTEALSEAVSDTLASKADVDIVRMEVRDAKYDLLKWFTGSSSCRRRRSLSLSPGWSTAVRTVLA